MSDDFDPEKVERHLTWMSTGITDSVVRMSDYDAVLAMYQEAMKQKKERDALLAWYRAEAAAALRAAESVVEACGWCTIARNKVD